MVVVVGALLAIALTACGAADPYSGTWLNGDKGTIRIQKANTGWWSIDVAPEDIHTYGAEIDGVLQTMNGGTSYSRSGDKLEFRTSSQPDPILLARE